MEKSNIKEISINITPGLLNINLRQVKLIINKLKLKDKIILT